MVQVNRYEEDARAAKVQNLVAAIDRVSDGVDNGAVYTWAQALTEDGWALVAEFAKVHLPSETTRKQVLGLLERRARIAHMRAS